MQQLKDQIIERYTLKIHNESDPETRIQLLKYLKQELEVVLETEQLLEGK